MEGKEKKGDEVVTETISTLSLCLRFCVCANFLFFREEVGPVDIIKNTASWIIALSFVLLLLCTKGVISERDGEREEESEWGRREVVVQGLSLN